MSDWIRPLGPSQTHNSFHTLRAKQPSGNGREREFFIRLFIQQISFERQNMFFLSSHLAPGFLERVLLQVFFKATDF